MPAKIVFRPILPSNPRYFANAAEELIGELGATMTGPVARILVGAEENYIDNWEHKPKIVSQYTHQKTQLKLTVKPSGTNKRYWAFVSLGARGKSYGTKNALWMTFQEKYTPKTVPGGVFNGPGAYSGKVIQTKSVDWPGIKPRRFEEHIVDKYETTIILQMGLAVERALRRVG